MSPTSPGRAVAFTPHPGPQTLAYTSFARELLYGGARGGGKTTLACAKFLPYAAKFGQDAFGAIFRQSYPELEQVQQEGVKLFVRTKWAEWRSKENAFRFKTGALLKLRFLESYADCQKYQGHQFAYMAMDESCNFSDERIFEDMRACLRSAVVPDKFWQILYTANPGGPMHHYLRNRFGIDRWPQGNQLLMDPQGRTRLFIPAKVTDNPSLSGTSYEQELRSIKDEAKRKAWLEGDWDVVSGAFFANSWSQANIIDWKEVPPRPWPIYRSMDWGSAEPFCVLWWTITNDDIAWEGKYWPRGAVVVLKEWYGAEQGSTNKGIRMLAKDVGKGIHEREIRWGFVHRCQPGPADTSIWDSDGGPSQADLMREGGSGVVEFHPAYKNRIVGWENMRTMMQGRNGKPHLYVSRSCEACIRTIPILKRSERDIEDVDTRQDDHAADNLRFICNQFIRPKEQPKKEHTYSTKTDRRRVTALDDAFGY